MVDIAYISIAVFYLGSCPKGHMILVGNIGYGIFDLCTTAVEWYDPEWSDLYTRFWNVVVKMANAMWLVAGVYWTYQIFPPDYDNEGSPEYCNKIFYLFSLVTITVSSVAYVSMLVVTACDWCWGKELQKGSKGSEQKRNLGVRQSTTRPPVRSLDKAPAGQKGLAMGKEKKP